MLPLTFADPADYDKLTGNDKMSVIGLTSFSEGVPLKLRVTPGSGAAPYECVVNHTFNAEQIEWFRFGSALNLMKHQQQAAMHH